MTFNPEFEGVDPHTHDDLVDAFYVLDGQGDFVVGDEVRRAGPGFFLAAPPGARHGFSNPGPELAPASSTSTRPTPALPAGSSGPKQNEPK